MRARFIFGNILFLTQVGFAQASEDAWPKISSESQCKAVSVKCITKEDIITTHKRLAGASSHAETCSMTLSKEMCHVFGMKSGQKFSAAAFKNKTQCNGLTDERINSDNNYFLADYSNNCCTVRHEFAHLMQPKWMHANTALTEQDADYIGYHCNMNNFVRYCGTGTKNEQRKEQCREFYRLIAFRIGGYLYDGCIAKKIDAHPESLTKAQCGSCESDCAKSGKFQELLPQFLGVSINQIAQRDFCLSKGDQGQGHGCDYYQERLFTQQLMGCPGENKADCVEAIKELFTKDYDCRAKDIKCSPDQEFGFLCEAWMPALLCQLPDENNKCPKHLKEVKFEKTSICVKNPPKGVVDSRADKKKTTSGGVN